ncbi:hypothetical protein [Gulosibacter molinativorax]|uniref:Uncharacterized protein n=1 Tax=Gulosibacter molinativorax TaxID=256821 RepID=A0ABT7C8E4_9MICO|nr:hypothetical protein [Gulosibacter molinativorax]MDJ1371464.1 hypothetical protein [Gulosibacter molinativorax]
MLQLDQAAANLGLWQIAVGGQFDQVGLLDIDPFQLVAQLLVEQSLCAGLVFQHLIHQGAHLGNEVCGEGLGFVVAFNRCLDQVQWMVRLRAAAVLGARTEVVEVLTTMSANRALDH